MVFQRKAKFEKFYIIKKSQLPTKLRFIRVGSERLTEPYEDLLLWIQKNHKSA